MTSLVPIGTLAAGTKIRRTIAVGNPDRDDIVHEGWIIELHEPSGLYRITAVEGKDRADWVLQPDQKVEAIA